MALEFAPHPLIPATDELRLSGELVSGMQIDYAPLLAVVDRFHVPQLTLPPDRYWGATPACSIDSRWPIVSSLPSPFAIRKLRDGLKSWENCLDSAHASD